MKVQNVHQRILEADAGRVGDLINGLASADDRLWPGDRWPPMRFDRRLSVGASGGHGPIRYSVEAYDPGRSVRFRFNAPTGFDGWHGLNLESIDREHVRLKHVVEMRIRGPALLTWPLIYRPLHNALIEDALDNAALYCDSEPEAKRWTPWVRALRWALGRRRSSRSRG